MERNAELGITFLGLNRYAVWVGAASLRAHEKLVAASFVSKRSLP